MLRFYFAVASTSFRRQLVYRWANLSGLITNIFFGSIFSFIIIALYQSRPSVAGYNLQDALRYTWLIQALIMVALPFSFYDLYWYWFSREMGRNCYYLFFRALPIYLAGMLLFGIGFSGDLRSYLAFPFVLFLGMMLGIAYRYWYNLIAFWIVEARAVAIFAGIVALFFTGSYVPLPFFPTWLRTIADWLPFTGLMNFPAEIFMGKVPATLFWLSLARQLAWVILLTLFVRWLTTLAARRVIVQGG
jgi:ABC-2 type transport system permease protein